MTDTDKAAEERRTKEMEEENRRAAIAAVRVVIPAKTRRAKHETHPQYAWYSPKSGRKVGFSAGPRGYSRPRYPR